MSVMDKLINAMRINPEEEYYEGEEFDELDSQDAAPAPSLFRRDRTPAAEEDRTERKMAEKTSYSSARASRRSVAGMEVCVIKPTSVEEARELTDTLLENRTVVLNLEGLDVDIAQRIIDFTSGSCYAIRGNLMKISHYIFVVTPESVDISGDITASMGIDESSSSAFDMPFA
ncbi:MAG: cell division protein SepF [Lachnospiraceae bacterium]|nr:cell division protein SepF [Lachnospiraceae bacterium]